MTHCADIFDLARREAVLEGDVPVSALADLCAFTASDAGVLHYRAEGMGERRGLPAARLSVEGDLEVACARCLKPVSVHISSSAVFRFTKDEAEANALPIEEDEEDEDVAVGSRHFDFAKWAEEEAILTLPRMAVHEVCEEKREWTDETPDPQDSRPNPFAALSSLRH